MQETRVNIVADIGGTNARFALVAEGNNTLQHVEHLACADFPNIRDAIHTYIGRLPQKPCINSMCLAVAGPVETDAIDLPNNHWEFSRSELQQDLGYPLKVINDFTAQLLGVLTLDDNELGWLGASRPKANLVIAALGPGTGLGVAGMTVGGEIIPSEGGHLAFAPATPHEVDLLEFLWQYYPRVSVERILSGSGLLSLYRANAELTGKEAGLVSPEEVTAAAFEGDLLCLDSVRDFIGIMGSVAGEVAIAFGARGGVYLCGGILPRLEGLYSPNLLRERFNDKGRFTEYCSDIPLALVKAKHNGLRGCVYALSHGY
jgi:glucokinase